MGVGGGAVKNVGKNGYFIILFTSIRIIKSTEIEIFFCLCHIIDFLNIYILSV